MEKINGFMHGVNLGGWLSQCIHTKEHYDSFISEEDFKTISEWGLDHVRLPVDYNLVETTDDKYNYSYIEENFKYIDNAMDWAKKYNLNILLDLHKTAGFFFHEEANEAGFFDDEKLQERFYKLWEEFTKRYAKFGNMVCFELLNEVTDKSYSPKWNAISTECIKRIRKLAPEIKIFVGSYWNNSVEAVVDLAEPYDKNVIYNFHCYEPLAFSHQGAPWISDKMPHDFKIPLDTNFGDYQKYTIAYIKQDCARFGGYDQNAKFDASFFEDFFASAIKAAEERNTTLYCGEYGVIDLADPKEALKWYKMICPVLDKYNIGRAAWSYKSMNFGLADPWCDEIRNELLKLL